MSGHSDEQAILREVGLEPVADELDRFYRKVLELSDEIRAQRMTSAKNDESAAAAEETAAMNQVKDQLLHDPRQIEAMLKRAPGANRLPELLSKVRELETHSRGGPYEGVLETMRSELEAGPEGVKQSGDAESQSALFGENFLLKPLVHYLSCWDVKQRKQLREQVEYATRMRDAAYDNSMQLVAQGKIDPARKAEHKCLECGEKALNANKAQREALAKLEKAACMDLRGYHSDASSFLNKWESMYNDRLETIQLDMNNIMNGLAAAKDRRQAVEQEFQNQLHNHAQRLSDNAHRRSTNLRNLRDLLTAEITRERELKDEERSLTALQQDVEEWKKAVESAGGDLEARKETLADAEDMLLGSIGIVNRMRKAEGELNDTLEAQLTGRKDALEKERLRLAREHYDIASYELKALSRKGDRLRRRAEILEQKRADCYFTIEMAYENETPVEEVRLAQQGAALHAQEMGSVRQQLEDLAGLAKTVDNDDLQNTMRLIGREHPQRMIRDDLQRERQLYSDKYRQHLKQEMSTLCDGTVQYVNRSVRELDEVTDHKTSDQAADQARHPAVFSPMTSRVQMQQRSGYE